MKKLLLIFSAILLAGSMWADNYLPGTWNGNFTLDDVVKFDANGSLTLQLGENQTYSFKMVLGSDWYGNNGTMTVSNCTGWVFNTSDGNCQLTTKKAGFYIFTLDENAHKLSVTYAKYYLAGNWNGNFDINGNVQFINNTVTLHLEAAKLYDFKFYNAEANTWSGNTGTMIPSNCTDWTFQADANAKFMSGDEGDYTFNLTWDNTTPKITAVYPTAAPTFSVWAFLAYSAEQKITANSYGTFSANIGSGNLHYYATKAEGVAVKNGEYGFIMGGGTSESSNNYNNRIFYIDIATNGTLTIVCQSGKTSQMKYFVTNRSNELTSIATSNFVNMTYDNDSYTNTIALSNIPGEKRLYFVAPSQSYLRYIIWVPDTENPITPLPDPTVTFNNSEYTVGGTLDLSTLFTSNSTGAVTYTVKDANGTGATIDTDGKTFSATTVGTATVTASQEETDEYGAASVDATITVNAAPVVSNIVYANTKGASTSELPQTYTEGVGVESFAALEDVEGFHFTGWSPASISTTATGEQTITAQWEEVEETIGEAYKADALADDAACNYDGTLFKMVCSTAKVATDKSSATSADGLTFTKAFLPSGSTTATSNTYSLTAKKKLSKIEVYYTCTDGSFTSKDQSKAGNLIYKIGDADPVTSATDGNKSNQTAYKEVIAPQGGIDNGTVVTIYSSASRLAIFSVVAYELHELTLVAKSGETYYATFSNAQAVEFDENVTVYTVGIDSENKLDINPVEGNQVPANTGVLISSANAAVTYTYVESAAALSNNKLQAASVAMDEEFNGKYYRLAYGDYNAKTGLGFYYGATDGAAFVCKAGTAYLAVENTVSAPARAHYIIGATEETGTATDVEAVEAQEVVKFFEDGQLLIKKNGVVYNVMGQVVR